MTADIAEFGVGERLRERKFEANRSDVVRYAGASGDFNPLHYDDTVAQAAGMAGAFAHGMFSGGCLATALTDAVGIDSLSRFAIRFRAQARLGVTLTSDIVVREVRRENRGALVELDCRLVDDDGTVVVSGSATAATPPRPRKPAEADVAPLPQANGLVGRPLRPAVVAVERGPAQVFAAAVKDDSPLYSSATAAAAAGLDAIPVPPTYLFSVANFGTFAERQPIGPPGSASLVELIAALRDGRKGAILHGEQSFTYWAPVRVGYVLYVEGCVEAVEEKAAGEGRPGMTVMVVRTDYWDESGGLLTTARSSYMFRPAQR